MTILIALAAIGLLVAVTIAAIIGMVSAAIRREEKHHTLTGRAPDLLTRAGRRLNGVYVRTPSSPLTVAGTGQLPSPPAKPTERRTRPASAPSQRIHTPIAPRRRHRPTVTG